MFLKLSPSPKYSLKELDTIGVTKLLPIYLDENPAPTVPVTAPNAFQPYFQLLMC